MSYYCHICNRRMTHTIYVCSEHERDPQTRAAYLHIIQNIGGYVGGIAPRQSLRQPPVDLTKFGVCADQDLIMDVGL